MSDQWGALTKEQQIYIDLLEEARIRIDFLSNAILVRRDEWPPRVLQEFCYLQYRMLCEFIATLCLIAHGDIKSRAALEDWRPPDIMKRLEKLGPDVYPKGIRIVIDEKNNRVNLEDYNVPQLTKAELLKLWGRSGDFLHLGKFKKVLGEKRADLKVSVDELVAIAQKFINLLDQHVISSADKKTHLIAALTAEAAGGKSALWIGKAR